MRYGSRILFLGCVAVLLAVLSSCATTYEHALYEFDKRDYSSALPQFTGFAEAGDARAQARLGVMYELGFGVTQDTKQAMYWYRKAADQGYVKGETWLGSLYQSSQHDYADALLWYRKAADRGDTEAESALGYMYKHGLGVPEDEAQADAWFQKAGGEAPLSLQDFITQIRATIDEHKTYPPEAVKARLGGKVTISFDYTGGGKATDIHVDLSSGDRLLDKAAIQAVEDSTLPLQPSVIIKMDTKHFVVDMLFGP